MICLLLAAGLVVYNQLDAKAAEAASDRILQEVQEMISQPTMPPQETEGEEEAPVVEASGATLERMPAINSGGYNCIGILSIPVLELELPVLDQWNYEKLKKAPCQYFGSCYDGDFVIAAHNYAAHFGRLPELQPGDLVLFTDAAGEVYCYEVVLRETLPPTATKEMITSGFDLTLYTCTPGGASRVTVRCSEITA